MALIVPLLRVAFRKSENDHVPDHPPDPISYSESAQSLLLYIIGLDRQMQALVSKLDSIEKALRTADGGSQLDRLHARIIAMESLLRKRAARK